jgi:hypothetical protein
MYTILYLCLRDFCFGWMVFNNALDFMGAIMQVSTRTWHRPQHGKSNSGCHNGPPGHYCPAPQLYQEWYAWRQKISLVTRDFLCRKNNRQTLCYFHLQQIRNHNKVAYCGNVCICCQGLMRTLHYARLSPKAWVVCREAILELVSLAGNAWPWCKWLSHDNFIIARMLELFVKSKGEVG